MNPSGMPMSFAIQPVLSFQGEILESHLHVAASQIGPDFNILVSRHLASNIDHLKAVSIFSGLFSCLIKIIV